MDKITIIFGILVILLFVCVILYFTTDVKSKIKNYTSELFTIIDAMSKVKCITPALKAANEKITLNHLNAKTIISQASSGGKAADPTSINNYNIAYNKYTEIYKTLSDCSIYCNQGDSSTGNCICPPNYPIPVQINGKIYCTNEDCSRIPNATFVPSTSKNPADNKCNCNAGYSKDSSGKGGSYCYLDSASSNMNNYSSALNNASDSINSLPQFSVYGTYTDSSGGNLYITSQADISGTLIDKTIRLSSLSCADECLKNQTANSFTFDPSTQECSLYSNGPSMSSLTNVNGTKIVGTKILR